MAMIKCSECGREISDLAKTCPGCGAVTYTGRMDEEQKNNELAQGVAAIILLVVFIAGVVLLFIGAKDFISDLENGWYNYKSPWTKHEQDVVFKLIMGGALIIGVINGAIGLRKKQDRAREYKSEWKPTNLNAGSSTPMWICPKCNTKNKKITYICDKCGYRRN